MQSVKSMKSYHADLQEALDDKFLRETLDKFAVAYRANRVNIFSGLDIPALIKEVADSKDEALKKTDELLAQFKALAATKGVIVHEARTASEANEIACRIARENNCKKIIKSKSMTAEEIHLNHALEGAGCEVTETDLGEWIIQNRNEGPTHMVMPAIHLSRYQVADLFTEVTGTKQDHDIQKLVKVARTELRQKFAEADMGISGANFAIADTGTIGICTNEGNGRLTSTLPRVHVAIVGIEKLVPNLRDALKIIRVLPRNATAQAITSYVSFVTGANVQKLGKGKTKAFHIIFLDNGRRALAKDEACREVLRCVRCGACANVCPVYRLVGGHKMGHVYIGAIGLILTYFFHGKDKARNLIQNCINCGACKDVCAAGVDLPAVISELRARLVEEEGAPIESALLAKVMTNRTLFHTLLKFAKFSQRPVTGGTPFIRHLPEIFLKGQGFRALPALAGKSFREEFASLDLPATGKIRVGLFAGCAQDFIYPEQLKAAARLFAGKACAVAFPMGQNCCGLPLHMMGERKAAQEVAMQNLTAFGSEKFDYIVTMCASCASHIKHGYPKLLENSPLKAELEQFLSRIIDFSSFTRDVLGLKEDDFNKSSETVTYHAPCHLCRGMGVRQQPLALLADAANYLPADEADTCCGFGGSYSVKFPEVSAQMIERKLKNFADTGAETLVTDCPGCVMQLRGGAETRKMPIKVEHMAEFLGRHAK